MYFHFLFFKSRFPSSFFPPPFPCVALSIGPSVSRHESKSAKINVLVAFRGCLACVGDSGVWVRVECPCPPVRIASALPPQQYCDPRQLFSPFLSSFIFSLFFFFLSLSLKNFFRLLFLSLFTFPYFFFHSFFSFFFTPICSFYSSSSHFFGFYNPALFRASFD